MSSIQRLLLLDKISSSPIPLSMKQARSLRLMLLLSRMTRWLPIFFVILGILFAVELRVKGDGEEPPEDPPEEPSPPDGSGLGIGPTGPRAWQYQPHVLDPKVKTRCIEQPTAYLSNNKNIWEDVDKSEKLQDKLMYLWQHMNMLDALTRFSAKALAKDLEIRYDAHVGTLQGQAAGTLSFDPGRFEASRLPNPPQKYSAVSNKFTPPYYAKYDDRGQGKGPALNFSILNIDPPKVTFLDSESAQVTGAAFYYDKKNNGKLARKTFYIPFSVRKVSAPQSSPAGGGMEKIVGNIARDLLPEQMLTAFNARNTANSLLNQTKIVRADNGIIARPSVPQDYAFVRYANLGCPSKDEALFWSDPMVVSGYDQALGTALNATSLKGYRSVDMDNIISRGYSAKIDQENMLRRPEERVVNPFKGYAARVVPGLIEMSKHGRLTPGEPATDDQLREAMKLTKKLSMLPSQNKEAWMPKASVASVQYSCRVLEENLAFAPPPRAFLAGQVSGSGTVTVPLDDVDEINYIQRLQLAKTRLGEIQILMDANRSGREYVQKIIESYQIMFYAVEKMKTLLVAEAPTDNEESNILYAMGKVDKLTPMGAIPHFTMLEKHITTSVEQCRAMLSQLEHQWDDSKQNQWKIIQSVLDERRTAIESLMSNAAMKYAAYEMQNAYSR
ncbi:MAG: hypothetical protein V1746_04465 [bacterium]